MGAIRGKWGILDWKEDEWSVINSEVQGGSPRLCRLRTDRLAPVSKFELCTGAYRIYRVPQT
jgi:hypothetical protein